MTNDCFGDAFFKDHYKKEAHSRNKARFKMTNEELMRKCQIKYFKLDEANNLLGKCHNAIGTLMIDIEKINKALDIERKKHLELDEMK